MLIPWIEIARASMESPVASGGKAHLKSPSDNMYESKLITMMLPETDIYATMPIARMTM